MKKLDCNCCGFKNPVGGLKEFTHDKKSYLLCTICLSTNIRNLFIHEEDGVALAKSIAWIGNYLLKEMKMR